MKKTSPSIMSGLIVGALTSVFGSFIFSIVFLVYVTWNDLDLKTFLIAIIAAPIYVSQFSIFPGTVGGFFLALWLRRMNHEISTKTRMGLLVGSLGGMVANALGIVGARNLIGDLPVAPFALLTILIAAMMGYISVHWLGSDDLTESGDTTK